ncbi:MAG TPA: CDP-alcohol phosphatidyltransferase family protein [Proteobacteria bacterium]|nr:CDP-alcohol phosphatidyltransferase family protein [Pseudomonadota bacterium]
MASGKEPRRIIERYKESPPPWLEKKTRGEKRVFTLPNLFTFSRFVILPFFAYYTLHRRFDVAFWLIAAAGIADILDGLTARALKQQSVVGAYMDPVADKFTLIFAYGLLWHTGEVPSWLFVIIVTRDIGLMVGILALGAAGYPPAIFPSWAGKVNTNLQFYTLLLVLMPYGLGTSVGRTLINIAFVVVAISTILSLLVYIWRGYVLVKLSAKRS